MWFYTSQVYIFIHPHHNSGHRWNSLTKSSEAELWLFFIYAWTSGWANNRDAGDLRRQLAHCDGTVIIIVDEKRTWTYHTQCIRTKIAKGLGMICKTKKLLNFQTLWMLYYCFAYPDLNYCIEVWGDSCKVCMQTLIHLQRKFMRIITNSSLNACVD